MIADETVMRERLRAFILEVFYVSDVDLLTDDVPLIDSGIVDSTGMLDVILFIEGEFGIAVADDEVVPDNLGSIDAIAAFVGRKRAQALG